MSDDSKLASFHDLSVIRLEDTIRALDAMGEGVAVVSVEGKIRFMNRSMTELAGRNMLPGQQARCCDILKHHNDEADACPVRHYPRGKPGHFEVFFPEYRYYEEQVFPVVEGGKPTGFILTVQDRTSQNLATQERRHLYLQVEEALRKLKRAEEEKQRLADQLKETEYRTGLMKLASIVFGELSRASRLLRDGMTMLRTRQEEASCTEAEARETLDELLEAASRTSRILEHLRQLRLGDVNGAQRLSLDSVLQDAVDSSRELASNRGVEIRVEKNSPPAVSGIRPQITGVLSSVILNAVEASKANGGVVTVRSGRDHRSSFVEVHDEGSGIHPEHLEQVFNPFFTTHGTSRRVGLGLTICLAIVQAHDGQVEINSEPGEGTRVRVSLPLD